MTDHVTPEQARRLASLLRSEGPGDLSHPESANALDSLAAQLEEARAELRHYRDHSPAYRVSFKRCEATGCIEARKALADTAPQEEGDDWYARGIGYEAPQEKS